MGERPVSKGIVSLLRDLGYEMRQLLAIDATATETHHFTGKELGN